MRFEEMTTMGKTIGIANHNVGMDLGRSILLQRNITEKREDLNLFMKRKLFVGFTLTIKVTQCHIAQGSNSREMSRIQVMFPGELEQGRYNLIAGGKDEGKDLLTLLIEQFCFH
jgi:hypothetical protein